MHIHLNIKSMKVRHVYIQVFAEMFFCHYTVTLVFFAWPCKLKLLICNYYVLWFYGWFCFSFVML